MCVGMVMAAVHGGCGGDDAGDDAGDGVVTMIVHVS